MSERERKTRHMESSLPKNEKQGALILGSDTQAVGIAQALGKMHIPVIALAWEYGVMRFSRYVNRVIKTPKPYEKKDFIDCVRDIVRKHHLEGWVVYPTDDDSVECISKYGKQLKLLTWGIESENHDLIVDKNQFVHFAETVGFKTPVTVPYVELQDAAKLNYPVIIKPRVKNPFFSITKKKAIQVDSAGELLHAVETLHAEIPRDHLLVQEYIPGDGTHQLSYASLAVKGKPVAELTACRLRQHPPDFGRASTYVFTKNDDEAAAIGRKVIQELSYTGLSEVEFKRHADSGLLYVLEVNPRTWGWHSVVEKAHGSWLAALHCILTGGDYSLPKTVKQAYWVKLTTDLPTVFYEMKNHRLRLKELIDSYRKRPLDVCSLDRHDVLPFICEWLLLPYLMIVRGF